MGGCYGDMHLCCHNYYATTQSGLNPHPECVYRIQISGTCVNRAQYMYMYMMGGHFVRKKWVINGDNEGDKIKLISPVICYVTLALLFV